MQNMRIYLVQYVLKIHVLDISDHCAGGMRFGITMLYCAEATDSIQHVVLIEFPSCSCRSPQPLALYHKDSLALKSRSHQIPVSPTDVRPLVFAGCANGFVEIGL